MLIPSLRECSAKELCRTCDDLHNGTCALCGCYVEARAAKKRQGCPKVPEMWGAEEAE